MIITAGPEAARSLLSSGKEGKSLAPIRQVDRGGEIAGLPPTWPGSCPQNFDPPPPCSGDTSPTGDFFSQGGWNTSWPCRPSSTGTCESGVVHGGLRLNSFLLPFFFEEYLGIRIHACGHPLSARRRSNTAATSVTTVPLSVCYGALNLLVRVDASNFVPYACDRAVTGGEYEGPEVPHSRPLVSLAAERSYRTSGTLAPVFPVLGFA